MFNIIPISLEQGFAYALAALGIAFAFRILSFPDLTVDGSFPLGGAVAARLILEGADPMVATSAAIVAGFIAGCCTGFFATKLKINSLLSGILRADVAVLLITEFMFHLRRWSRPACFARLC
jgi:putative ABC transport system permease protein